jgi:16S rRNA (guanine527-N7)-methyltransferase
MGSSSLSKGRGGWPIDDELAASRVAGSSFALSPEARHHLDQWLDMLALWNSKMDLTAARSADELADLMLADAFLLAATIETGARVVDVGSGAGAPGLPLALARPDLSVTLVEPLAKRVAFLRTVLGTLRRTDVVLERARGDDLRDRPPFDVAVSRATLAPEAWLTLGLGLVRQGGSVWVLLAREAPPEHPEARRHESIAYTWPRTGAERTLVRYERLASRGGGDSL